MPKPLGAETVINGRSFFRSGDDPTSVFSLLNVAIAGEIVGDIRAKFATFDAHDRLVVNAAGSFGIFRLDEVDDRLALSSREGTAVDGEAFKLLEIFRLVIGVGKDSIAVFAGISAAVDGDVNFASVSAVLFHLDGGASTIETVAVGIGVSLNAVSNHSGIGEFDFAGLDDEAGFAGEGGSTDIPLGVASGVDRTAAATVGGDDGSVIDVDNWDFTFGVFDGTVDIGAVGGVDGAVNVDDDAIGVGNRWCIICRRIKRHEDTVNIINSGFEGDIFADCDDGVVGGCRIIGAINPNWDATSAGGQDSASASQIDGAFLDIKQADVGGGRRESKTTKIEGEITLDDEGLINLNIGVKDDFGDIGVGDGGDEGCSVGNVGGLGERGDLNGRVTNIAIGGDNRSRSDSSERAGHGCGG